jgi:protein-S-isoprenylcysteine O-methyltransferase Ste14
MVKAGSRVIIVGVVAALVQFGLAIMGWGGFAGFFAHTAFWILAVVTVGLMIVALLTAGNVSPGEKEDRGNRWVLSAFSLIALVIAFVPAYTDRIGFWTIDGAAMRWIGIALYAGGGALRLWPVFVLGNRFSGLVAIQPGHRLETGKVYRLVRNPSYLGMITCTLGWVLTFRSGVGVLLTALMLIPLVSRIRAEERLLRGHFGVEYEAYCAQTRWRLIPLIY